VSKQFDTAVVEKFMNLFRGRTDEYGLRNIDTGASWYEGARNDMGEIIYDDAGKKAAPNGLTLDDYRTHLHLTHGVALAIIPNSRTGNVWFGCLDIDKDDIDHVELVRRIKVFGLPLHVFISRSGAAHVYIFFDGEGKPANVVRKMLAEYALALGCGKDLPKAEIFPNQDDFDESVLGHHITIPLYNSDSSDRRGKFVSENGDLWGVEGFLERVEVWPSKRKMPFPLRGESFEMGPPCLETIQRKGGMPAGHRNNGLYNVGVYMKKAYPEDWEERLISFNRLYISIPVERKEIDNIVKSVKKKDYKYKCASEPIASVCEKEVCQKRQFGIRSPEQKLLDEANRIPLPISKIRKFTSEPPSWELTIDDKVVSVATKELHSYALLRIKLMESLNRVQPNMKQQHWDIKLQDLLSNHLEEIEVGPDSGDWAVALDIIDQFVKNGGPDRVSARNETWLKWNKSRMGSDAHFTIITTKTLLTNHGITMGTAEISTLLKKAGWESVMIRVDSATTLRVWRKWHPGLCPTRQNPEEEGVDDGCDSRQSTTDLHDALADTNAG